MQCISDSYADVLGE